MQNLNDDLQHLSKPVKQVGIQSLLLAADKLTGHESTLALQLYLLKTLFGSALPVFIQKVVQAFELVSYHQIVSSYSSIKLSHLPHFVSQRVHQIWLLKAKR